MIRVFVGEDTYRAHEAYRAAREAAAARGPVVVLRDEQRTVERIAAALHGQTLFGEQPAVAIEELTLMTGSDADAVTDLLAQVPKHREVLVWERGTPPARSKVWRALQQHAGKTETFVPLTDVKRRRWIEETVRARGGTISPRAVDALLAVGGTDLWALANEIEKLARVSAGRDVTPQDVEAVTQPVTDVNIFETVRALAAGDSRTALTHLLRHAARGDDPRHVLALTIREVRLLLLIRDRLDRGGRTSAWDVARTFHLPSHAVSAILATARATTTVRLKALFDRLVASLYALNTGRAEPEDVVESLAFRGGYGRESQ